MRVIREILRNKLVSFLAMVGVLSFVGLGVNTYLNAAPQVDNTPDCDNVAIMYCGAFTESQFKQKWNSDGRYGDHDKVFGAFGIQRDDVNGMVDGIVWRDGRVTVGNQTVATGATTAARNYGGTRIPGTQNAAKVSTNIFVTEGQTAMVKIVDGQFKFAVIKSCGNPVTATPTPPPKPPVKDIQVCDLATRQVITIKEDQFDESKHSKNLEDCKPKPQPVAECTGLTATISNRNQVALRATATTSGGATVQGYDFRINAGERTVFERTVTTGDLEATTDATLEPGDYTATVTVKTSVGDKAGEACTKAFTIAKPKTPGVDINKDVDGVEYKQVGVNVEYTYNIVVRNTGETDLKDVVVTDNAPKGVSFVRADKGTISDNKWSYTIPELKMGDSERFAITAKVPEYLAGKIVNTACVDAPSVPGNPDDCDDATVDVPKPPTPVTPPKTPVTPPAPETPPALPTTGPVDTLLSVLGAGSLAAATVAYVASRRQI